MHTFEAQHAITADALPVCPAEITLADGITKARVFSWTEGGEDSPIVGVYMLDGHGLVPAAWRADGTLYEEGRLLGSPLNSGLRISGLPSNVVAFHSARLAERERRYDPMQSLVRQIARGFDENGPDGPHGEGFGPASPRDRVIEIDSEDGSETILLTVRHDRTAEDIAKQYGHRARRSGVFYWGLMTDRVRDALASAVGAPLPTMLERRRERAAKGKPKNKAA